MIGISARRVIAKYIEDPDQGSSYRSRAKSWSDNQNKKTKVSPLSDETKALLKGADPKRFNIENTHEIESDPDPSTYNPYEYSDPSTKPKSTDDGGPFENILPYYPGSFSITKPTVFTEGGPLNDWMKARRRDWTDNPTQQAPAISITRKWSCSEDSVKRVILKHLMSDIPLRASISIGNGMSNRTAASLTEIRRMMEQGDPSMFNKTINRARSLGAPVWSNKNDKDQIKKGFYIFSVPGSSGENRTVAVQFLRTKKQAPRGFLDFDVEMSCTCESFLFFGAQYYAVQGKYMYMPGFRPSLLPPHPRSQLVSITRGPLGERKNMGKGLNFRMCKHIMRVVDFIERNFKVDETITYKNYPRIGRPSFVVNAEKWKEAFGFPFTIEEIRKQLLTGLKERPGFYYSVYTREKSHYNQVDEWVRDVFNKLPPSQRIAYLRFLSEHPEEIFYILWSHALSIQPEKIDPILVNTGFRLMDRTIKSKSEEQPASIEDEAPGAKPSKGPKPYKGPNMTGVIQPSEIGVPEEKGDEEVEEKPEKKQRPKVKGRPTKIKGVPRTDIDISKVKSKARPRSTRKSDIKNEI